MRVLITFKVGDGKGWNHTRHFDLDQAEAGSLKRDFLTYINGGIGALNGTAYTCLDPDTEQPRELAVRFEDILYIEFVPQTTSSLDTQTTHVTGKTPTGPLQTRLGTSPLQARAAGNLGGKESE